MLLNIFLKEDKNLEQNIKIQNIISQYKDILGQNSRILVRKSGTEPCVRIMVEGENYLKVHKLAHYIKKTIKLL